MSRTNTQMTDDAVRKILVVYEKYLDSHYEKHHEELDCYIIEPTESYLPIEIRGHHRKISFDLAVVSSSECVLYVTEDDYMTIKEIRVRNPQEVLEVLRRQHQTTNWKTEGF